MSFLSDLVSGNFSNLGNDLNPSNAFSDFGGDAMKVLSNPIADVGIAASIALPFLAPEILPAAFGGAAAADVAGIGVDAGVGAALDAGGGALSGLTTADVSFLDPTLFGEAAAPGAVAPAVGGFDLATLGPGASSAGASAGSAAGAGGFDLATLGPGLGPGAGGPIDLSATPGAIPGAAPGAIPGAAPGAAPAAGGTDVLSKIGTFMGSPAGKGLSTVAGATAGLGGLGYSLYQGQQAKKANDALNAKETALADNAAATAAAAKKSAQPLITSGDTLMSFLTTNTLPPQFQSMLDQQIAARKAGIVQGYASRGMSGDPKKNSGLQQDLANVDAQAETLKADLESKLSTAGNAMVQTANSLLSTGLSATQLSAEIPIQMAKLNSALNAQMSTAIANFAAALNGGNRGGGMQAPQNMIGQSGNLNFG